MANDQIIETLNKWQRDGRTKTRGVFVTSFDLQPNADGFTLTLELHVDGEYDTLSTGYSPSYVYGKSLSEVLENGVALIESKKDILRKALED